MDPLSFLTPTNSPIIPFLFYTVIFVAYFTYCFFIIYHLVRFGVGSEPKVIAMIFFIGILVLVPPVTLFFSKMDAVTAVKVLMRNIPTAQMSQ